MKTIQKNTQVKLYWIDYGLSNGVLKTVEIEKRSYVRRPFDGGWMFVRLGRLKIRPNYRWIRTFLDYVILHFNLIYWCFLFVFKKFYVITNFLFLWMMLFCDKNYRILTLRLLYFEVLSFTLNYHWSKYYFVQSLIV